MKKSIINISSKIEVISEGQNKDQIVGSIQLVSNNPEVIITNRINSDVSIESHTSESEDSVYVDYFRFSKKN